MIVRDYPSGWPIRSDWTTRLNAHFQAPGFQKLCTFVEQERQSQTVYPSAENVFTAFRLTSYAETKVVILGQDPYHGPRQAHGLSFSVENDMKLPPSLNNIYREFCDDLGLESPASGNLTMWAKQGVFLLNTVLTVRQGQANSHRDQGWESFTDEVIAQLNARSDGVVFILWGKPAEKKAELIDRHRHVIITSPHPSPLSAHRGFYGSRPFSKANEALQKLGRPQVVWDA
jgi:uracil-DNA glycosylase